MNGLARLFFKLRLSKKRQALEFYRKLIPKGSLCFDVGANRGAKTELLLGIPAEVIAVEPDETLCHFLIQKNGNKISVEVCGVSDKVGSELFFLGSNSEVSTFSTKFIETFSPQGRCEWGAGIERRVTSLDALILKWGMPFFIKLDIEGYEEKALAGLNHRPELVEFEFTSPFCDMAIRCVERLAGLGLYQFNFSPYESFSWHYRDWLSPEKMVEGLKKLSGEVKHGNIFARS